MPLVWVFSMATAIGCGTASSQPKDELIELSGQVPASNFDPNEAGTIHGQVVWQDEIPNITPFLIRANPIGGDAVLKRQFQPNPNTPKIDQQHHGVANAVVFLRGVDATKAKVWNLPPVHVEMKDLRFHILQGKADSSYGFVRRGDPIEMVSRDAFFHSLHLDGANYLTLAFPDLDKPLSRPLENKGLVELTSSAGYYWMRAYLFVDDHPYYTRTDSEGRFALNQVPPGEYEVVCWMPSWLESRHERDPESGVLTRLFFRPPVTWSENVKLQAKESKEIQFGPALRDFQRP
jgi:hypothetical protein